MKYYWLSFGNTDPRTYTGLAPTFIQFFDQTGSNVTPPAITEPVVGSGAYRFSYYTGYSSAIYFLVDGATSGLSADIRYINGSLDPNDTISLVAGNTLSTFGTTVAPTDLFGYAKRSREWLEGSQNFIKTSGQWNVLDRGASVLLGTKTLTSSVSGVTASI